MFWSEREAALLNLNLAQIITVLLSKLHLQGEFEFNVRGMVPFLCFFTKSAAPIESFCLAPVSK